MHDHGDHHQEGQRQPVQVHRVGHPDQRVRQVAGVQRQTFLAAGEPALAGLDRDRIAVERVPDVNHYTILLAPAGARRVADRIAESVTQDT